MSSTSFCMAPNFPCLPNDMPGIKIPGVFSKICLSKLKNSIIHQSVRVNHWWHLTKEVSFFLIGHIPLVGHTAVCPVSMSVWVQGVMSIHCSNTCIQYIFSDFTFLYDTIWCQPNQANVWSDLTSTHQPSIWNECKIRDLQRLPLEQECLKHGPKEDHLYDG